MAACYSSRQTSVDVVSVTKIVMYSDMHDFKIPNTPAVEKSGKYTKNENALHIICIVCILLLLVSSSSSLLIDKNMKRYVKTNLQK